MTRRASCCCGQCAIEVEGEPAINGVCHCGNCKQRTGSAFGWSCYFPDERVLRRSGDLKIYEIAGANPQQRWFCARCGTTLSWTAADFPGLTGIAGGCFADPTMDAPNVSVSDEHRCAWVGLPADWRTSL